jgi:hypothetical protein
MNASSKYNFEIVKLLIENNADVNIQNADVFFSLFIYLFF